MSQADSDPTFPGGGGFRSLHAWAHQAFDRIWGNSDAAQSVSSALDRVGMAPWVFVGTFKKSPIRRVATVPCPTEREDSAYCSPNLEGNNIVDNSPSERDSSIVFV